MSVEVLAAGDESILTDKAIEFVAVLHRELNPERLRLLAARQERKAALARGEAPAFLDETAIREGTWQVAPAPADLRDRRCEITGPPERKMMINALNSGARVFMADFEDACSPTWTNLVEGQRNLHDAVRRTIELETPEKAYRLNEEIATLVVRPRGWHLLERHLVVDGELVSASLFDFGLALYGNGAELLERGSGPYFYLPKLESHLEARLWAQAFALGEETLGLPSGSIRCTVLIETILAAFEMEEILHELRDYGCALNAAGRVRPVLTCLADVSPEDVTWIWRGRVAAGKLNLIAGDPGLGKSFVTLDLIARYTTGRPMPDGSPGIPSGTAILLSAEDGLADTIRPRLDALGADVRRVHYVATVIDGRQERSIQLADVEALEEAILTQRTPGWL